MEVTPIENSPRYVKIAIDIAYRIYRSEFKVGYKLRGRSTLAGEYNVSPETIRRSAILLQNMDVVVVHEKSGTFVKSKENAKLFIDKFTKKDTLNTLMTDIRKLRAEKMEIEKKIDEKIELLLQHSIYFKNMDTTSHNEEIIEQNSPMIGKTVIETQFWQNTDATIVAIIRENNTHLSPGPYFEFKERDIICFVSGVENVNRVKDYINPKLG